MNPRVTSSYTSTTFDQIVTLDATVAYTVDNVFVLLYHFRDGWFHTHMAEDISLLSVGCRERNELPDEFVIRYYTIRREGVDTRQRTFEPLVHK